ncbi:hypothetical protein CEUSTIGMA_g7842.t1 [Chlamydomonas eustigma]|uniref:ATP synthase mitochondrial F1 complex assembly factor 2 n=1 Tax=Chlamydomonas eustigma TaxID=1157962 RepID=A0A250XBD6_9CHLO|nr:hypothetical protein CEUSTIGMA_g7842.t1 [Chlamydomonas eustigma]|eukprot:GAX80403.1 hypothetical protein CEUSTIGMA_g7842.t1 [Chlamydomonas eustigma]
MLVLSKALCKDPCFILQGFLHSCHLPILSYSQHTLLDHQDTWPDQMPPSREDRTDLAGCTQSGRILASVPQDVECQNRIRCGPFTSGAFVRHLSSFCALNKDENKNLARYESRNQNDILGVRHERNLNTGTSSSSQSLSSVRPTKEEGDLAKDRLRAKLSGLKRFYKTVDIRKAPDDQGLGYTLHLGRYPIKTPGRNLLILPSLPLALAVGMEWEWQESSKPASHTMPIMSLCATAIDQPKPREKVIESLLKYIHTDSALCRYEPGPIAQRQAEVFDPVISWVKEDLGWSSLHHSESIFGTQQQEDVVLGARTLLTSLDCWHLAAVEQLTYCGKSLLLALALARGKLGLKEGMRAARLEELLQLEEWGEVEAGHDLDAVDVGSRVSAPILLLKLLNTSEF